MEGRKDDQNTNTDTINTITEPNTKTMIDRYVFASNFCKRKSVLDCPTGHGYGAMIIKALGATYVHGVDIDKDAIAHNIEEYENHTQGFTTLSFSEQDMTKEWKDINYKYDCIVSIEGFEHIPREDVPQMLKNFKATCKPGGTIIITTPRRKMPVWDFKGGTHLYEYSVNEYLEELGKVFSNVELYFAVEFRHPWSPELNTIFTQNPDAAEVCAVMVAVITNE